MPIYEYACRSCEHRFETIQKAAEEPLIECPSCARATLKKLLSAPVFRLKGSGWYETDFKTGDKRNVVAGAGAETDDSAAANGGNAAAKDANGANASDKDKSAGDKKAGDKSAASADKPAAKTGGDKALSSDGAATKVKGAAKNGN